MSSRPKKGVRLHKRPLQRTVTPRDYIIEPMTVCIAAICEDGKAIVAATDKAVTSRQMASETMQKIIPIADSVLALTAGNAVVQTEIIGLIQEQIGIFDPTTRTPDNLEVKQVAEMFEHAYLQYWQHRVANEVLAHYGLDLDTWKNQKNHLLPTLVDDISAKIDYLEVRNVQTIVAGLDDVAHLWVVTNGVKECYDSIGYACIGDGGSVATAEFIKHNYAADKSYHTAIYLSFLAKKRAEAVQGIGKGTDLAYLFEEDSAIAKSGLLGPDLHKFLGREYALLRLTETMAEAGSRVRLMNYAKGFFPKSKRAKGFKEAREKLDKDIDTINAEVERVRDGATKGKQKTSAKEEVVMISSAPAPKKKGT